MRSEIGSNFWEYSLNITKNKKISFWWESNEYYIEYFKSGRNALKALCKMLNPEKKTALLPAYTCSTVLEPFIDEGWDVDFYFLKKDLSIDENSLLDAYLKKKPYLVLFHNYFGFNTLKLSINLIRELKTNGTVIVEDLTQSLFSFHHIPFANYYISSLRKFVAVPDGGFLLAKDKLSHIKKVKSDKMIAKIAFEAFDTKEQYFKDNQLKTKELFRNKFKELNEIISDNTEISDISPETILIYDSLDIDFIRKKRQDNYRLLFSLINDVSFVEKVIICEIDDNIVPLFFPIYVEKERSELQSYLASHRVYCPIIWPKPNPLKAYNKVNEYMYSHMLCLPIDQRYGEDEMNMIIELIKAFK